MRKILCATDLLPKSEAAIERAALLAEQMNASLTLLHVVTPLESERALADTERNASARLRARGVLPMWRHARAPNVVVRRGDPSRVILQTVRDMHPDLVVLGPHRPRGLRDALKGTIAAKILEARVSPVLIARAEPTGPYDNVLLALDLSAVSRAALTAAETLVLAPDAQHRVLHAFEAPREGLMYHAGFELTAVQGNLDRWRQHAVRAVRELLKHDSADPSRYHVFARPTPAGPAILRAMDVHQPDLLVLGTRARSRMARVFLGSVANEVLRGARGDVFIVPDGTFDRESEHRGYVEGFVRNRHVAEGAIGGG